MRVETLKPELAALDFLPGRVLRFVDVDPDGHLLWMASTTPGNYPRVSRNGQLTMLCRWILEETAGPAPGPEYTAGHVCHDEQIGECPLGLPEFCWHRLCLRPDHLDWMTLRANLLASSRTVAFRNAAKDTCSHGHILTWTTDSRGRSKRRCWECPPRGVRVAQRDPAIDAIYADL